ncbi:MAG: hypothetical protein DI539_09455 [Flavobacterium psychrophilum]|nr:MAG: hypothetical protein DI539_09455 [Flavobacterium psychrophilum]
MEILFNNQALELDPNEKVVLTLQQNDLGDISKSNTSFTNSFKIKKTGNNVKVMEYLGVNGSSTRIPYQLNRVTIIENSIVLMENGYAEITDNDPKNYTINIYGAEKNFFEKVKNLTLKDAFPDMIITWTNTNLVPYLTSNEIICLPIAQYNKDSYHTDVPDAFSTFSITEILNTTPHFFVKHLFESIFTYLGYTLNYPIGDDEVFKKMVIPCQKGVSHFNISEGTPFNIKNCVQEVGCDVLIKEIMYRYGMSFSCDESRKIVTFTQLNTLIKSASTVNWSEKFDSHKSTKYNLSGYARKNYFLYSEDTQDPNYSASTTNYLRGQFEIDNERLGMENTVITSQFQKAMMYGKTYSSGQLHGEIDFGGSVGRYSLMNVAENLINDDGEVELRENPFQLMYLKTLPTTLNVHLRQPTGNLIKNVPARICTHDFLSFQYFIDQHYPEIVNLFNNMVVLKGVFKLSLLDVYRFNFYRRIYLEQYGSFFYVNRISNWENGKLCEVELIQIPPVID